jgi:predicted acyltransferase
MAKLPEEGNEMPHSRDLSLDAFRGLTVLLMVIVNIQGNGDEAYAALKHAEWNGLTLADLVFPWFLFIVGLSVPLALDRVHSKSPWPQVLRRALVLFALGVILSWLIRPVDFDQIRWMGVLQRIGIVYLACAAVVLLRPGWKWAAGLAITILALHSWLVFVPVGGVNSLTEGMGLNASLDQQLLPGRLLRKTWDPEGVLSTLPAIASGLLGVAFTRLSQTSDQAKLWLVKVGLLVSGFALALLIPINKQLWTASFVLLTAGLALTAWRIMQAGWEHTKNGLFARFYILLGQTALTLYVIHMLLLAVIVRKLPDGTRIWDVLYAKLAVFVPSPGFASLLFALIAGTICVAPLGWLMRRGWLVKA